jgi:hypothetical protein
MYSTMSRSNNKARREKLQRDQRAMGCRGEARNERPLEWERKGRDRNQGNAEKHPNDEMRDKEV